MYYLTEEDYAVAKSNGISRKYAYKRYYEYNYDRERAITEPVGTSKRVTPNMLLWEEWKDVAEANGITKHNFYNRLNTQSKKKWTPEAAATIPIGIRQNTRIHPKIYALAEENGIKRATLQSRVFNLHWNPHRAATEKVDSLEGVLV